ncbi:MAG: hypothetical protein KGS10_05655 [Chloroflexi bacterium]|nr:hypothetical protein [Chloroflexota bacterium]
MRLEDHEDGLPDGWGRALVAMGRDLSVAEWAARSGLDDQTIRRVLADAAKYVAGEPARK